MSKKTLIVMRAANMTRMHPLTEFSHQCSKCGEVVGIYPSGQSILKQSGEEGVEIVCDECVNPLDIMASRPAPGAMAEVRESVRRKI